MRYADEEKKNLVQRYQNGESPQLLCTEYSISRSTLYRWARIYCVANPGEKRTFTIKEYDMLCHRLEKSEHIIEILKTVRCTVHADLKEKLSELEQLYGQYDIHTLCEALDVDRGTFYNHMFRNKKNNAWFEKRREEYRILIREVFNEYRQVLGAEKIRMILM